MATSKKRPAKKKVVAKKPVKEVKDETVYDNIECTNVDGITVYSYKNYTSIKLSKIKRYVEREINS
jgi:hypothetical protein